MLTPSGKTLEKKFTKVLNFTTRHMYKRFCYDVGYYREPRYIRGAHSMKHCPALFVILIAMAFMFLTTMIGHTEPLQQPITKQGPLYNVVQLAQTADINALPPATPAKGENLSPADMPRHTDKELITTYIVLGFGVAVLIAQSILLFKGGNFTANDVLKNYAVTLIIIMTMATMTIGFNDQQISPVIGLFGTIIGFLLGQSVKSQTTPEQPTATPPK